MTPQPGSENSMSYDERELDNLREKLRAAEQETVDVRAVAVDAFALIAVLADGNRPAQRQASELRKRIGLEGK